MGGWFTVGSTSCDGVCICEVCRSCALLVAGRVKVVWQVVFLLGVGDVATGGEGLRRVGRTFGWGRGFFMFEAVGCRGLVRCLADLGEVCISAWVLEVSHR